MSCSLEQHNGKLSGLSRMGEAGNESANPFTLAGSIISRKQTINVCYDVCEVSILLAIQIHFSLSSKHLFTQETRANGRIRFSIYLLLGCNLVFFCTEVASFFNFHTIYSANNCQGHDPISIHPLTATDTISRLSLPQSSSRLSLYTECSADRSWWWKCIPFTFLNHLKQYHEILHKGVVYTVIFGLVSFSATCRIEVGSLYFNMITALFNVLINSIYLPNYWLDFIQWMGYTPPALYIWLM